MQVSKMKNRFFWSCITYFIYNFYLTKKISINQFKVNEIIFENNKIISDQELREDLSFYTKKI